jgi:two-component system sensor histidine kinase TrcS
MFGVSALVAAAVLAVGALTIYTLRDYVTAVSDTEVAHSLAAFKHSYTGQRARTAGEGKPLTDFTGQSAGTVIAVMSGDEVVQAAMFDDDGAQQAPAAAITALESLNWAGGSPQTVDIGELGRYRVSSRVIDGERLISAVSLRSANEVIAKKTAAVAAITIVAAVLAAAGTVALVRQALRPLRGVAATAAKAARIPLGDENHRITARVRHADSDPDNEVGIVGETLNRLLANVDSALAARAESERRMRRFITDASHELRTPLATIQGYAELTRQEGQSLPATTEYALARIESESRRMSSLVGDMLLLSRLGEGQGLEFSRIDLCALVADAINDIAVTARDHQFMAELPDDPIWVRADRERLHQVVGNLLANACIHTPAGVTVTTAIQPSSSATDPTVELTVTDDGPGIDPQLVPDLFGRFVRADKARSRERNSSGLGLAIVASITEAHGGSVAVESRPGRTVFRVRLPAANNGET